MRNKCIYNNNRLRAQPADPPPSTASLFLNFSDMPSKKNLIFILKVYGYRAPPFKIEEDLIKNIAGQYQVNRLTASRNILGLYFFFVI